MDNAIHRLRDCLCIFLGTIALTLAPRAEAASYTWSRAGSGNWNQSANWTPNSAFPNVAGDVASISNGSYSVALNQDSVTIGALLLTPQHWTGGHTITGDSGQRLVFDNGADPAQARILMGNWAGSIISAPVVLNSHLEVSTSTAENRYALTFRGPVSGAGTLVPVSGRISFSPITDVVYHIPVRGTGGHMWKRGTKRATFTATNSVVLAGDWGGNPAIADGGALVISGGIFTNLNNTGRSALFGNANNMLLVTSGGRLIHASETSLEFSQPLNTVEVTGPGSRFSSASMSLNSRLGQLRVADGGRFELGTGASLSMSGFTNTIWIGSSAAPSVLDLKGKYLVLGESDAGRGNRLVVDAGGIVTNGAVYTGEDCNQSVQHHMVVTNGGRAFVTTGAGLFNWYHRTVTSNSTVVTGSGSILNNMGQEFAVARILVGGNTGRWNIAQIENGGVLTNCSVSVGVAGDVWNGGATAIDNWLVVTNGGRVFCMANSTIGKGDGWYGKINTGISNVAWVVGGPAGTSAWNMGNKDLAVGYPRDIDRTHFNALRIGRGGIVSNVKWLAVGGPKTICNRVSLEGGTLVAASLNVYAANSIAPVIDADGLTAMTVSGTATLANGSYLTPQAASGAQAGTYTVLTAGTLSDHGIRLDPAADPFVWSFAVAANSLTVTYRPRGPAGTKLILR